MIESTNLVLFLADLFDKRRFSKLGSIFESDEAVLREDVFEHFFNWNIGAGAELLRYLLVVWSADDSDSYVFLKDGYRKTVLKAVKTWRSFMKSCISWVIAFLGTVRVPSTSKRAITFFVIFSYRFSIFSVTEERNILNWPRKRRVWKPGGNWVIPLQAFSQFIVLEDERSLCFGTLQELIAFLLFYGRRPNSLETVEIGSVEIKPERDVTHTYAFLRAANRSARFL